MRLAAALLLTAAALVAQAPPGYYATVDTSTPALLRSTLHQVIDDHQRFPYTSGSTDTWNVLNQADQHPTSSSQILDVYRNASFSKISGGSRGYNREHSWPKSFGFPIESGIGSYPFTDCHTLRLCDDGYNTARSNRIFDNGNAGWTSYPTDFNNGIGGGSSSTHPGFNNWATGSGPYGAWEVWSDRKGDIARSLLYMDVRYEGGTHNGTGVPEPDLILTDNVGLIQANSGSNQSVAYMGKLSVLLLWHAQDPVDAKEINRNNVVFGYQGNRNPFVDHPEWVDCIFNGACGVVTNDRDAEVWINEFHYDNGAVDVGEFVELAGHAGERLDGWMLLAYDGATGDVYDRMPLFGTFPDQQNGLGTLHFPFPGLQDGVDGLALVTSTGAVMQFLSYEGTFTASEGAAAGLTSVLAGSESPTTPTGRSLQLTGLGGSYGAFSWAGPTFSSPGLVNAGQTLQ